MFDLIKNKNNPSWVKAGKKEIKELKEFIKPREYFSVSLTSRLNVFGSSVYIEKSGNKIISALLLDSMGVICPVLSSESSIQPLSWIIRNSVCGKKRYITIMGIEKDVLTIEKLFPERNKVSVDYDLLTAISKDVVLNGDLYLKKKNAALLESISIRRASNSNIKKLMPLRKAYELEEVILNPEHFNEQACKMRLSRTVAGGIFLFAEIEGAPAATCCVNAEGFEWSQIGGVYTIPEYRSRGISARLITELAKRTAERNKNLTLFVKKDNKPALKLYSNCGFINSGCFRISYLERR